MGRYKHSNNPIWLCCLPLWHFVTQRVAPFERAQLSAKHDQGKPVWWGIDGIKEAVESVKKTKWFVAVIKILFSSLELKAQMSFFDHLLSKCLSVNISHFHLHQFQLNIIQNILGWRELKFLQMKMPHPFPRGNNNQIVKIHCKNSTNWFRSFGTIRWPVASSQELLTRPILTKVGM